jgi:hypothetical protein
MAVVTSKIEHRTIGSSPDEAAHPWGWTAARRARQAEAIRRWQPWVSARGPTSPEGKAASSRNAARPDSIARQVAALLVELRAVERMVNAAIAKRRGRKKAGRRR